MSTNLQLDEVAVAQSISSSSSDDTPKAVPPLTSSYSFESNEAPNEEEIRIIAMTQDTPTNAIIGPRTRKRGLARGTAEAENSSRTFSLLDNDYFTDDLQPASDDYNVVSDEVMECRKVSTLDSKDSGTNIMGSYTEALFQSDWLSLANPNGGVMIYTGSEASGDDSCLKLPAVANSETTSEADESSVFSGGYFDRTDFVRSNWMKALDGPAFGFAVVALATAIIHPVFFVAGALTAFGVLKAAGAGYDCCLEGDELTLNGLLFRDAYLQDETAPKATETAKPSSTDTVAKVDRTDNTSTDTDVTDTGHKEVPVDEQVSTNSAVASPTAATQQKHERIVDGPKTEVVTRPHSSVQMDASHVTKQQTPSHNTLSLDVVEQHYPKLAHEVVKDVEFPGLNALEFFQVFFADDAPFNFRDLQKKRGDIDIHYGQWETSTDTQFSLYHEAEQPIKHCDGYNYRLLQDRVLSFKAQTGSTSLFGPMYAATTKAQRILVVSKRLAIMENKTTLKDIPFCDRFYVMDRWIVTANKEGGRYVSKLSAWTEVMFTKRCQFESQIRSKSCTAIKDLIKAWCTMAKEALKLTEEEKLKRLLKTQQIYHEDDTDGESMLHYPPETLDATTTEKPPQHYEVTSAIATSVGSAIATSVGEGVEIQLENVLASLHLNTQNHIKTVKLSSEQKNGNSNDTIGIAESSGRGSASGSANSSASGSAISSSSGSTSGSTGSNSKTKKNFRRSLLSKYWAGRQ